MSPTKSDPGKYGPTWAWMVGALLIIGVPAATLVGNATVGEYRKRVDALEDNTSRIVKLETESIQFQRLDNKIDTLIRVVAGLEATVAAKP